MCLAFRAWPLFVAIKTFEFINEYIIRCAQCTSVMCEWRENGKLIIFVFFFRLAVGNRLQITDVIVRDFSTFI